MSANSANIRMLKALSGALDREAGHFHGLADRKGTEAEVAERLRIAAGVGNLVASACNEAAEAIKEQDRLLEEPLKPKPGDPVVSKWRVKE